MYGTGVIIIGEDRRISLVTPGAEDLLGWQGPQIQGLDCRIILDCQDAEGVSLCGSCDCARVLETHEMTPARLVNVSESSGGRVSVNMSFWYLPPAGFISESRAMAVLSKPT